jgi:hypothetical protein
VRGAKGVVHEDVAELRHLARKRFVVLLLALVQAHVLKHHHLAGRDVDTVEPVTGQAHRAPQQFSQTRGHRLQRIFRLELTFRRATKMRGHHHRRARIKRQLHARHRGANPRVLSDATLIVLRHIEISANENALALHLALADKVFEAEDVHV